MAVGMTVRNCYMRIFRWVFVTVVSVGVSLAVGVKIIKDGAMVS